MGYAMYHCMRIDNAGHTQLSSDGSCQHMQTLLAVMTQLPLYVHGCLHVGM